MNRPVVGVTTEVLDLLNPQLPEALGVGQQKAIFFGLLPYERATNPVGKSVSLLCSALDNGEKRAAEPGIALRKQLT